MEKYLISKEDMKIVSKNLVFKNKLYEAIDDSALALANKLIFDKIAEKISDNILEVIQPAIHAAIEEMPEIEI